MVTPVRRGPKVKKTAATKKKAMKTSKPLTTGNLQNAIALRQYTDTMRKISGYLDKRKGLAPKVWHMLESGMMEEEDLVPDDRVPPSVNKVRLLSLDNLKMLATKLHEVRLLREAMYKHFLQIKTKTDAVKVFCFWMRTLDTSALPSKQLSALLEWTVGQARASGVLIEKTVMVPNNKQGRHAGILGDFNSFGVFAYAEFDESTGCYSKMLHNHSGISIDLEEIHPTKGWTISENWNEWTAQMKGPKGVHSILQLFTDTENSTKDEDKFMIPMPTFILEVKNLQQEQGITPGSSGDGAAAAKRAGARSLARHASVASSCVSAPSGSGGNR